MIKPSDAWYRPTNRYAGLLTRGAEEMELEDKYVEFLKGMRRIRDDQRGKKYYDVLGP